jgi:hypothetical protein
MLMGTKLCMVDMVMVIEMQCTGVQFTVAQKLTDEEEIQVRWKSYFQELQKKMPVSSWNKLSQ